MVKKSALELQYMRSMSVSSASADPPAGYGGMAGSSSAAPIQGTVVAQPPQAKKKDDCTMQ